MKSALFALLLVLSASSAAAQWEPLELRGAPTTLGGLEPAEVAERIQPALPSLARCYSGHQPPSSLHVTVEPAGTPTSVQVPADLALCVDAALARVQFDVAPAGSRRLALIRFSEPIPPPPSGAPAPEAVASDGPDGGLILGVSVGLGALVGTCMMLGSTAVEEPWNEALLWPGLVMAAPGYVVLALVLLLEEIAD